MRTLLLLTLSAGSVQVAAPQPDPREIVRRSVQAIEADWNQAPGYSFQERDVQSRRGDPPTVKTYQVLMVEGSPYHRLLAIDDRPLSAKEQSKEERKLRDEIGLRQHESPHERARRIAKYEKDRRHDHAMLMDMVGAFDFRLAGEENVNGHDCWILDAQPKPGLEPKDRETKVLSGMQGRLWIAKGEYQWVRVQAEVFRTVTFLGFLAKVGPGTRIHLEQEQVADNLWLPKSFSVRVKAAALGFIDESSTDDETYREYKPMPKMSAGLLRQ